jgi:SAM-dependent methyltransferase
MNGQTLRKAVATRIFTRGVADVTSEPIALDRLGLEHPDRAPYVPSAWWILRWLLPTSAVQPTHEFVEFGCGKGRIVLDAARRYRFARVTGVELSPELSEIARDLIARERRLRCGRVSVETRDATMFEIPDTTTHAYFFNPFKGESFQRVLSNLCESLDRAPRKLTIIYINPEEHDRVIASGRFRVVRRVHTTRLVSPVWATIYES